MPSDIIVTNQTTLQRNFAANAQEIFCNTAFQAGSLGTGLGLLWLTPFAATGAIASAAGLLAMAACPNGIPPDLISGGPPEFTGGQCYTEYIFQVYAEWNNGGSSTTIGGNVTGPVQGAGYVSGVAGVTAGWYVIGTIAGTEQTPQYNLVNFLAPDFYDIFRIENLTRQDGQPDDCGDRPGDPPALYEKDEDGFDIINDNRTIDNSSQTFSIPIQFDLGGINGTLNFDANFNGIINYIPLTGNFSIGGIRFGVDLSGDEPIFLPTDENNQLEQLRQIQEQLNEIQNCVCNNQIEIDELNLPLVQEIDDVCSDISINLLAVRGTYPVNIEQQFEQSRVLADKGCSEPPPNVPRNIILQGEGVGTQQVFTSEILDPEVRVVEFEVTQYSPDTRLFISGNNNANQGRFGIVSPGYFDTDGNFYAMPGRAQYYERSLVVIPDEINSALGVRVSVSVGTKFNLWDTGLRFSST